MPVRMGILDPEGEIVLMDPCDCDFGKVRCGCVVRKDAERRRGLYSQRERCRTADGVDESVTYKFPDTFFG